MPNNINRIGLLLKTAFIRWWAKDPFKESAVIAYYAIFSLPGLLVVLLTTAGYFVGSDIANKHLESVISKTMGPGTAEQIHNIIATAMASKNSIWATIIGVATILVGATGVFAQFQKSLNIIWEVKANESRSGLWSLIRVRLFSFGLILAIAFIMMVSFVATTLIVALGDWLANQFSDSILFLIQLINFIISRLVIAVLFALMFKFFPDAKIKWNHVWLGSIVTALLFLFGMSGLSLYFAKADPGGVYGVAGSVILILLWVSYSSMIVFYGAEFTYAYAIQQDGYIPPDKHAVKQKGRKV